MSEESLLTPKQLAERVNVHERKIRRLINDGRLEYVMIGCRKHIREGAWPRFLDQAETKGKKPCHDEIKGPVSVGFKSGNAGTSSGQKTVAAASAALARQTANKLKSSSCNGSNCEAGETAQVIPLKSS